MVLLEAAKGFNNLSEERVTTCVGARMKPEETRCHVEWKKEIEGGVQWVPCKHKRAVKWQVKRTKRVQTCTMYKVIDVFTVTYLIFVLNEFIKQESSRWKNKESVKAVAKLKC